MEKHVKTELHLSEEQLQAITGGCKECAADLDKVATHHFSADTHLTLFKNFTEQGHEILARLHLDAATEQNQAAKALLQRIVERGHLVRIN